MAKTTKTSHETAARLRAGNRFLLTSHVNPDGDAVGSTLGLARLLHRMGKGALVWLRDAPPPVFRALPGAGRIHTGEEPPAGWPDKFDGVVVLECPALERTGLAEALGERPIVNIDHHLGNQHYGKVNWVDAGAPAVGEMVYRLAQGMHLELDADTADLLLLTIVTDTGGFRFANATADAFRSAAELVEDGARPERVSRWVYESQPVGGLRLLKEMLETLELHADGRVASVRLEPEMFERAGAEMGDSEGLIDYPRSIAGVEAVALLRRRPEEGGFKISLRSRGDVDVQKIARDFDGGGHKNAAGAYVTDSEDAEEVEKRLVDRLVEALDGQPEAAAGETEPAGSAAEASESGEDTEASA